MVTIEQIDEFRKRTNSSYEDARFFLERHHGDVLEAIIDFEKAKSVWHQKPQKPNKGELGRKLTDVLQKGFDLRMTVEDKTGKMLFTVPILLLLLLTPAWPMMLFACAFLILLGYKLGFRDIKTTSVNVGEILNNLGSQMRDVGHPNGSHRGNGNGPWQQGPQAGQPGGPWQQGPQMGHPGDPWQQGPQAGHPGDPWQQRPQAGQPGGPWQQGPQAGQSNESWQRASTAEKAGSAQANGAEGFQANANESHQENGAGNYQANSAGSNHANSAGSNHANSAGNYQENGTGRDQPNTVEDTQPRRTEADPPTGTHEAHADHKDASHLQDAQARPRAQHFRTREDEGQWQPVRRSEVRDGPQVAVPMDSSRMAPETGRTTPSTPPQIGMSMTYPPSPPVVDDGFKEFTVE